MNLVAVIEENQKDVGKFLDKQMIYWKYHILKRKTKSLLTVKVVNLNTPLLFLILMLILKMRKMMDKWKV